jgi:hypothetical protein
MEELRRSGTRAAEGGVVEPLAPPDWPIRRSRALPRRRGARSGLRLVPYARVPGARERLNAVESSRA